MLEAAVHEGVDAVYILGDYADFYDVHQHGAKDPRIGFTLEKEIEDVNKGLDELEKLFPKAELHYIEGNHEYRLERFLMSQAPQLMNLTSVKHQLCMQTRGRWTWHTYCPTQKVQILNSKLYARHEPLGGSAKATLPKALCSLVYGHIHRIEEAYMVGLDDKRYVAFSVGWLGDPRLDKVFGYVKGVPQWQHGFGLVYVDPVTRYFYHEKIPILENMTCVVNGKILKG